MFSNASTPRGGPDAADGKAAAAAAAAAIMGAPRCAASCASSCSTGSEPASTPLSSQQNSVTQTVPPSPSTPASAPPSGAFNSFSAAKKTLGRLLGAGSGAPWSADGSGTPAQSPTTGSGLIAAFRAIIPNTSNGSTDSNGDAASPQPASPAPVAAPAVAPAPAPTPAPAPAPAPLPAAPGAKSQLLALCPTLPPSMQRAEWCLDDYIVLEKLYKGYASVVYKGICKRSREVVVLKSYTLSSICELYQHQIFREVRLHSSLQHENIVKLYAAFKEGDRVVLIQEYADGGDLFSLLQKYGGRLGEKVAVQMVLEPFLRVLQYLHTRSIVHRDIKPENILFTKGSVLKLADFGLAIDLREERAVTRAGTLDYMAPEILKCPYKSKPEENKEKEHLHYGNTVDAWAVGVMTFELLTGCPPFYDQSRSNTEARIKSGVPAFPPTMSDGARSFIATALNKDPVARPSTLDMLHHSWVDAFRMRRSMRAIPDTGADALPAPPASARAPGAPAAIPAVAVKPIAALQAVEAMLSADRGAAAAAAAALLHSSGVVHSAASSPCLGARAPAPLLHKAAAAAVVAAGQQQQQQQQHQQQQGSVQLTPPMPMEM